MSNAYHYGYGYGHQVVLSDASPTPSSPPTSSSNYPLHGFSGSVGSPQFCSSSNSSFNAPTPTYMDKDWIDPNEITEADVLCGRGKDSHAHFGNKRFQCIIQMNRDAYQQASTREEKTDLSNRIVQMIRSCGGRFLKRVDKNDNDDCSTTNNESSSVASPSPAPPIQGLWKEVSASYAREKVSHALRSAKDPNRVKARKPRTVKKYEPSENENQEFEDSLSYQQKIFQWLTEQDKLGKVTESELEESDACLPKD